MCKMDNMENCKGNFLVSIRKLLLQLLYTPKVSRSSPSLGKREEPFEAFMEGKGLILFVTHGTYRK